MQKIANEACNYNENKVVSVAMDQTDCSQHVLTLIKSSKSFQRFLAYYLKREKN